MNNFYFWDEMAAKSLKSNRYQEAIQAYQHALKATENLADQAATWANLGNLYLIIQNIPAAVDAFLAAAQLDPTSYDFDCILQRITSNRYLDESAMNQARDLYAQESLKAGPESEAGMISDQVLVVEKFPVWDDLDLADQPMIETGQVSLLETEASAPVEVLAEAAAEIDLPETLTVEASAEQVEPELVSEAILGEVLAEVEAAPEFETQAEVLSAETINETLAAAEFFPAEAEWVEPEAVTESELNEAYLEVAVENLVDNHLNLRFALQTEDLIDSIRRHGILQPLVVTPLGDGKYLVVTGNRRLEAARQIGLEFVPVVVRMANERELLELALIENIQHVNLEPLELAEAYYLLSENFGMSLETIAETIGKSYLTVVATIDLLKLTEEGKQALQEKAINEGHARALVAIDLPALQNNALVYVLENRLGIRQTEDLVRIILNAVAVSRSYDESFRETDRTVTTETEAVETPESESSLETGLLQVEADCSPEAAIAAQAGQVAEEVSLENPELEQVEIVAQVVSEADLEVVSEAEELVENILAASEVDEMSAETITSGVAWLRLEAEPADVVEAAPVSRSFFDELFEEEKLQEISSAVNAPVEATLAAANGAVSQDLGLQTEVVMEEATFASTVEAVFHQAEEHLEEVIEEIIQFTGLGEAPSSPNQAETSAEQPASVEETTPEAETPAVIEYQEPEQSENRPQFKGPEAIAFYRRVVEANPANVRVWNQLGTLYSELGQHAEAIDCYQRTIELDPDKFAYHFHLGLSLATAQRYPEAIQALEKTIELAPQHVLAHCSLAGCYRRVGNEAEAQKHVEIARPKLVQEKAYNRACFESISGNVDQALDLLKIAVETEKAPVEWLLRDPDLGFIRDDPRFQILIAELSVLA